jgi:2-amino-4-hydroxy-6-hydroxymethyldihydropteridine diphosphokinase
MTETVYLALGTNLGDRVENLRAALQMLLPVVSRIKASPVYETPPWGFTDQPAFLNMVVQAESGLPPLELLGELKRIEVQLGRQPNFRYGPRLIDLDILLYGQRVIELENLTIPHPRLPERAFVLVPLADLAPDLVHPVLGASITELLKNVERGDIRIFNAIIDVLPPESIDGRSNPLLIHLPLFSPLALGKACRPVIANLNGTVFHTSLNEGAEGQHLPIDREKWAAAKLNPQQAIAISLTLASQPS